MIDEVVTHKWYGLLGLLVILDQIGFLVHEELVEVLGQLNVELSLHESLTTSCQIVPQVQNLLNAVEEDRLGLARFVLRVP